MDAFLGMSREWFQREKESWDGSCVLWQRKDKTYPN